MLASALPAVAPEHVIATSFSLRATASTRAIWTSTGLPYASSPMHCRYVDRTRWSTHCSKAVLAATIRPNRMVSVRNVRSEVVQSAA